MKTNKSYWFKARWPVLNLPPSAPEATGPTICFHSVIARQDCEGALPYKPMSSERNWLYNFQQHVDYINLLPESTPTPLAMLFFLTRVCPELLSCSLPVSSGSLPTSSHSTFLSLCPHINLTQNFLYGISIQNRQLMVLEPPQFSNILLCKSSLWLCLLAHRSQGQNSFLASNGI